MLPSKLMDSWKGARDVRASFHITYSLIHTSLAVTEEEKTCFEEIKLVIKKLNGVGNAGKLPIDMQMFLKKKTQEWREAKQTAPRANTRAVVQDARLTLDRISDEVCVRFAHI
jgi:copper chaperone CopZ